MNKARDIKNPYEIDRVILAAVSDEIQLDENLEPPFVRVRDTNSQFIEIDSSKNPPTNNPSQLSVLLDRSMPRVNRLSIVFFAFRNFAPNINPRNNVFTFIRGGVPFTATIAPDQNLTGLARYTALVTAMNVATGVPGEFTVVAHPTYVQTFIITNTLANLWRFNYISNGVVRGRYLWGINQLNYAVGTDAVVHILSFYTESYSRYIDIISYELTQYTKIDISGVNVPAECIFRYFLTDVTYGQSAFIGFNQTPSLNYDRSRAIVSIDINLLDEFGELYYVPNQQWPVAVTYIVLLAAM